MSKHLANLTNLQSLKLDGNFLTGPIPTRLGNLGSSLFELTLSNNSFEGGIPDQLSQLQNLEILILSENQLEGQVGGWLSELTNLRQLDLSGNQLVGQIGFQLIWLTQLEYLFLNNNQFSG